MVLYSAQDYKDYDDMSKKQEIRDYLIRQFFKNIDTVDEDLPVYEQAKRHKRELDFYIANSLNMRTRPEHAIHYINPKLFNMCGFDFSQNMESYESNPHDDSVISKAFAFKMLVGE